MLGTVNKELPVILTEDEFAAKAAEMATATLEIERLMEDKKNMAADYKLRIDEKKAVVNNLANIIERRAEIREVECEERLNPDRKLVEIYRTDTGEMVDTRGITQKDIQQSLDFHEEKREGTA